MTNREIATEVLSGYTLDRGHAPIAREMLKDAITAALDAKSPPPGHILDDGGVVRKVLGTLPITADGCVIGVGPGSTTWIYTQDGASSFACADGWYKHRYSTRELAEAVRTQCVEWTGSMSHGYGYRRFRGKMWRAHRVAWVEAYGDIPEGQVVCHSCDNRACVNPEHLFLATPKGNSRDMVAKGRSSRCAKPNHLAGTANGRAKLDAAAVDEILATNGDTRRLADKYGVDKSTIYKIRRGINWKAHRELAEAARAKA